MALSIVGIAITVVFGAVVVVVIAVVLAASLRCTLCAFASKAAYA